MINFDQADQDFIASRPYFKAVSPGARKLFTGSIPDKIRISLIGVDIGRNIAKKKPAHEVVGSVVHGQILYYSLRPVKRFVGKAHRHMSTIPAKDWKRKNGMGGRSWYTQPSRQEMIIIFHDANRAGPHVDVHIGRLSLVYKVKPDLYEQLKYNKAGYLTQASKDKIISHIQQEVLTHSRVPQNLDHTRSGMRSSWVDGDTESKTYGSGKTRQIVAKSRVDIFKAHKDGPIEMYAPLIHPSRSLYLYRLYNGESTGVPILIWGAKVPKPPSFLHDRLHLKLTDPSNYEREIPLHIDPETSTAKYDGSSAYIYITPKGTTLWSPRKSVVTGEQIEYTQKLGDIASAKSDRPIVAMGEVLFKKKGSSTYLPQSVGSGFLNSNDLLPEDIEPEIRIYRVDSIGRIKTYGIGFWENRALQDMVSTLHHRFHTVELMDASRAKLEGYEGVVAAPHNGSVNEGIKVKWWTDPHDWRIDSVEFKEGEKGGIAGVVWCTSLESNKRFKLGPGQVGSQDLTRAMMDSPDKYVGRVLKVASRHGHEGRAAKVISFHDDKGVG